MEHFSNLKPSKNHEDTISIMFSNIKSVPDYNNKKNSSTLRNYIDDEDFDIVGLAKVNKYLPKVPFEHRITCRI